MSSCLSCNAPLLTPEVFLCPSCWQHWQHVERRLWPGVRRVLDALGSSTELATLAKAIATMLDEGDSAFTLGVAPHPTVAQRVTDAITQWKEFRAFATQFPGLEQGVWGMSKRQAFVFLVHFVVLQRRRYRRRLRQRFGIDIQRRRIVTADHLPRSPTALLLFDRMLQSFLQYEMTFRTVVVLVQQAQREGFVLEEIIIAGVKAIGGMLDNLPEFIMPTLAFPDPASQERGALLLAGFVRPKLRLYGSLREALAPLGDPRTVVNEMLPDLVIQAFRSGTTEINALVRHVGRLLDHTRRTGRKKAQRNAPEPALERLDARRTRTRDAPNELEEWYAHEEAAGRLDALIPRARLAPAEVKYLSLRRRGWSKREIAAEYGVVRGTVSHTLHRAYKKLKAAGS